MKFILASNILEHHAFSNFISDTLINYPRAEFLVAGDLLNIFPEPGEYLEGSIFYELYGELINELDYLVKNNFKGVEKSPLIKPLQDIILPVGKHFFDAQIIAIHRYKKFFNKIERSLRNNQLYFIPGNMDYPILSKYLTIDSPYIHQIDNEILEKDGVIIGGIGGVPNTNHPFRGIVEISPYEMTEAEYERRLKNLWGVDVLITHVSPEECLILNEFLANSPLKLLICRAPFNFRRQSDFRGPLELYGIGDKYVIKVRPFEYPQNQAYVIDLVAGKLTPPAVEVFSWRFQEIEGRGIETHANQMPKGN